MNQKMNILIVEDDLDLSTIMKRFLESEGFDAVVAPHAEQAYDVLTQNVFDLMIFDINLPGDDGIELCRHIRRTSSAPVIFVSARVGDDARALSLECGGDAYLSKPFSLRELSAQVNAVLKRMNRDVVSAQGSADKGISIDTEMRQVYKNGSAVDLSPKEYELVALLMRNAGRALSKDRLLADVWGAFSDVEPQTLAVHMSWIRAKLEDDPSHPRLFVTVRGYGYRYDAGDTDET